jgi:hypothetical protein
LVEKHGAEGALRRATQGAIEALNCQDTKSATEWLHVMRVLMEDRVEAHKVLRAPAKPMV